MECKEVTYKHLKPGQEIRGIKFTGGQSHFVGYVKFISPAFVTVEMWRHGGVEEIYSVDHLFLVEMTEDEFREKYNAKAGEIVRDIQKELYKDEIGYHEMYNVWLSSNPWEMAQVCLDKKLTVIGHCKDIIPKTAMFSGDKLDVGVCVEDEETDRFWCHFRSEYIRYLVKQYEKYQKKQEGRKENE